jgi:hypothetical protein
MTECSALAKRRSRLEGAIASWLRSASRDLRLVRMIQPHSSTFGSVTTVVESKFGSLFSSDCVVFRNGRGGVKTCEEGRAAVTDERKWA